ncbi:Alpha-1,2-mannosyltransferase ALG9 [Coccomyxa sp. Obi]|nr:Alpha-1,2-mannosyltransferase ALG9 [Coccomyxa sp. Obi]
MFGLRKRRNRGSGTGAPVSTDGFNSKSLESRKPSTRSIVLCLLVPRLLSSLYNIIHDCDEVYNYWEPLHFLLYGYGMQTWEYSAQYALRSHLYLLLHALVGGPAALWLGAGAGKAVVFYLMRAVLALISVYSETALVRATRDYAGVRTARLLLLLLTCSAGMFSASSALLPSSFVMYFVTLAAAAVIDNKPLLVVVYAVVGVILGWVVAGVAFLPFAFFVLFAAPFSQALGTAIAALLLTFLPMVVTDRLFYGKWAVTLWNFVRYNVVGGGDSSLYGVESSTFYLRNAFTNLNFVLPLALLAPLSALVLMLQCRGTGVRMRLAIAVTPVWVWGLAISLLPHKEERFLYPVYPLICLSAALTLGALPAMVRGCLSWLLPRPAVQFMARAATGAACAAIIVLSLSRSLALRLNYGAPMHLYSHLPKESPELRGINYTYVCTGSEWHRFPSSFFLPGPWYRLAFVKSDFHGLLPRPFDLDQGGTAAAPPQLNSGNREEPDNYWPDASHCRYFVGLQYPDAPPLQDPQKWDTVVSLPFVDATRSTSSLLRAFYVPKLSDKKNFFASYVLLRQR